MAFNCMSERDGSTAKITLIGDLDAASAPAFKQQIEAAAAQGAVKELVLLVDGLDYIASAGLRVLIFARQQMGSGVDIYVIGAQEQVLDTLEKTGFSNSVILQDTYA
jgi:anti-anti-sigma factor